MELIFFMIRGPRPFSAACVLSLGAETAFPSCSAVYCTCVISSNTEKMYEDGSREDSGEDILPVRDLRGPAAL